MVKYVTCPVRRPGPSRPRTDQRSKGHRPCASSSKPQGWSPPPVDFFGGFFGAIEPGGWGPTQKTRNRVLALSAKTVTVMQAIIVH